MKRYHAHRQDRRELLLCLVGFLVTLFLVAASGPADAADPRPAELVAAIRAARGDAIARHRTLDAIAQRRAAEIVTDWSHDGAGAPWPWGENLAWTDSADPIGWTLAGWRASPGHAAVLFGDWSHVGVGFAEAGGRVYIAAVFARIPAVDRPTITLPPTDAAP